MLPRSVAQSWSFELHFDGTSHGFILLCACHVRRSVEGYFFSFDVLLFIYFVTPFFFFFFVLMMVVVCVLLCCPDILFGVCFAGRFAGRFVLTWQSLFHCRCCFLLRTFFTFRFRKSSLYRVLIFLYLVSMYLVFRFLRCNPVCASFVVFGHVTCLLLMLFFFFFPSPSRLLGKIVFCSLGALGCLQEKAWGSQLPLSEWGIETKWASVGFTSFAHLGVRRKVPLPPTRWFIRLRNRKYCFVVAKSCRRPWALGLILLYNLSWLPAHWVTSV